MAVQYNSDTDSWTTWIDKLKQEVPTVKKEISEFFELMNAQGVPLNKWAQSNDEVFDKLCKQYKVTDTELKNFLRTWDGSGDVAEAFQAHLKNSANGLTLFQRAGKAAGGVIKSLGATLGSMAAMWAIVEVISLAITGLDRLVNHAKYASEESQEEKQKAVDKYTKDTETVDSLNELISKYKELREVSDYDTNTNTRKQVLDVQDKITNLVGKQASNLDLVNGKLDTQLGKLNKIKNTQQNQAVEDARNAYYASKDSSQKLVGDQTIEDGLDFLGVQKQSDLDVVISDKDGDSLGAAIYVIV